MTWSSCLPFPDLGALTHVWGQCSLPHRLEREVWHIHGVVWHAIGAQQTQVRV